MKKFILLIIGLVSACVELPPDWREPFVGNWTITKANEDSILKPAWVGVKLELTQVDETGGTYSLSSSPDISICPQSGTWLVSDQPNLFIRGDIVDVLYAMEENQLTLSFLIPRNVPCVEGEPCLGMVYGNWSFEATR